MGDREAEKKVWEIEQGALVAHQLNKTEGFDYKAEHPTREPADVVLTSASGKYKPFEAQVVSIPLDFRCRDDKQTVQRVQTTLTELLKAGNVDHIVVGLVLSGEAEMHGIPRPLLVQLAELIIGKGAKNFELRYENICELSPELAELLHNVFVSYHHDIIKDISVDVPAGGEVPLDGRRRDSEESGEIWR